MKFVTARQVEAERCDAARFNPCLAEIEMQIAPERGKRSAQWSVVTARVVVVFPELLEARANEERVGAFKG